MGEIKLELLHKGLNTAKDPALLEEGELTLAINCRYKSGDPAVHQAEGRAKLGTLAKSGADITQMVGMQWDPGTVYTTAPGDDQLTQICWIKNNNTINYLETVDDPATMTGTGQSIATPTGATLGTKPLRAVQFENEHFLLSGGDNIRIYRDAGGQKHSVHGLPEPSSDVATFGKSIAGTPINYPTVGLHFYWFTWYDSTNDIESTHEGPLLGNVTFPEYSSGFAWELIGTPPPGVIGTIHRICWITSQFTPPDSADSIRIYKSLPLSSGFVEDEVPYESRWPYGWRIATVSIGSLSTGTENLAGYGSTAVTYYDYDMAYEDVLESQPPFEAVSIVSNGNVVNAGQRGVPPQATTGDVMEESLLLNDINDLRKVKWSYPGDALSFPATFYINFETDQTDEVKNITSLGNAAGVFLGNSVWKINWLPNQSDFEFSRGRVKQAVSETIGTLGNASVAKFDWPGKGPVLAFVDRTGVYATDLNVVWHLTEHIDWSRFISTANLNETTALVNNSDQQRLELIAGSQLYFFHYDDMHIREDGSLAITGAINRPGLISAICNIVTDGGLRYTVTSDGNGDYGIYYEGYGWIDESEPLTAVQMQVKTRNIYPWGPGREGHTFKLFMHVKSFDTNAGIWTTVLETSSGGNSRTINSDILTTATNKLSISTARLLMEYYNLLFVGIFEETTPLAVNFLGIECESMGSTESNP